VIKASGRSDEIVVSSFDPVALVQFHRHVPEVALGYIFGQDQAFPLRRGWAGIVVGASLVHPQHTLCTEKTVGAWHRAGRPINVWTVDDRAELLRLAALGVDGVFANDPAARSPCSQRCDYRLVAGQRDGGVGVGVAAAAAGGSIVKSSVNFASPRHSCA